MRRRIIDSGNAIRGGVSPGVAGNGVYVYGSDFLLYTNDSWNTAWNDQALGIALITNLCRLVISKDGTESLHWGVYGKIISGCTTTADSSTATSDFKGYENTTAIIDGTGSSMSNYAAKYCRSRSLPNGQRGYLAASGEWSQCVRNKSMIDIMMGIINGEPIQTGVAPGGDNQNWHHASTQYDANGNWGCSWGAGQDYSNWIKNKYRWTRPFFRLV